MLIPFSPKGNFGNPNFPLAFCMRILHSPFPLEVGKVLLEAGRIARELNSYSRMNTGQILPSGLS